MLTMWSCAARHYSFSCSWSAIKKNSLIIVISSLIVPQPTYSQSTLQDRLNGCWKNAAPQNGKPYCATICFSPETREVIISYVDSSGVIDHADYRWGQTKSRAVDITFSSYENGKFKTIHETCEYSLDFSKLKLSNCQFEGVYNRFSD